VSELIERVKLGVDVLNYILPEGVPRNSLILIEGSGGSGKSIITMHIAREFISRGEEVLFVELDDDPETLVDNLSSLGVDPLKLREENKLFAIDGYSFRIKGKARKRCPIVVEEINPQNIDALISRIINVIDGAGIMNRGLLILDSLNEVMAYSEASKVGELVRELRANIAKARGIVTIVVLHTSTEDTRVFANALDYVVDGVIEAETVTQTPMGIELPIPLRQIMVKKMKGVSHRTGWTLFTIDKEGVKPVVIKLKT